MNDKNVKLLAFYLPQYHEIPENNEWWGNGFTEWTNVKRGRKLHFGHYQPKVPLNNNYYDLSDNRVMQEQAKLAKDYGIYGFCFYHYYFTGKKLLEKPLEEYLKQEDKIPYCFSWANQSWARTWYGKDCSSEVLLDQTYGEEKEWKDHFEYLLKFFLDSKYIKVNNCPMFLIYLTKDFKRCNAMMIKWSEWAQEAGFDGIHFVAMDTGFAVKRFWSKTDATVDFEPMRSLRDLPDSINRKRQVRRKKIAKSGIFKSKFLNSLFIDNICTYDMINRVIENREYSYNIEKNYLGVFTSWDNSARKDESCIIVRKSTPKKFKKYLVKQIEKSRVMNNDFLFINAWNEWSEGAYLEPDEKHGYAYLSAVKNALKETNN